MGNRKLTVTGGAPSVRVRVVIRAVGVPLKNDYFYQTTFVFRESGPTTVRSEKFQN